MKNTNDILTHLKFCPEFKKLNTHTTLEKLINTLPMNLKKGVKFAYIKKDILYFVLTHQVYKMEFSYNKELIWSLLKTLKIANILDINFFVTNIIEKKEEKLELKPHYKERSFAIFENHLKDNNLHKKIEEIRNTIKNNL